VAPWASEVRRHARRSLGDPDHPIECFDGDGGFALLSGEGAGTQPGVDQRLVVTDRGLGEVASAIAGGLLPAHAAARSNESDMLAALARRVSSIRAQHRRDTRRNDDGGRRIRLPARDRWVHWLPVIGTIRRRACDRGADLFKQDRYLPGIVSAVVGQHAGDDLTGVGVHGEMKLAPGSASAAVLLFVPLALSEPLEASAIDDQMRWAGWHHLRLFVGETAAAPAQGGVIRCGELRAQQPEHAAGERLRLAQGEMEHEPHRQHQPDRHVRVERPSARRGPPRRPPSRRPLLHPPTVSGRRAASAQPHTQANCGRDSGPWEADGGGRHCA
jgi:hypothetical protein